MALRELLVAAVRADGRSLNEISKAARLTQSVLHRFVNDGTGMTDRNVDRLLAALGKEVRLVKAKGGRS
jgi:hypothetical protein